jgi:hypothetical protein
MREIGAGAVTLYGHIKIGETKRSLTPARLYQNHNRIDKDIEPASIGS